MHGNIPTLSLYIGLMSGTSLDGIDAVLADFSSPVIKVLASYSMPFPQNLQHALKELIANPHLSLLELGKMHTELGECYSAAVQNLLLDNDIHRDNIKAIGNHGQTIYHHPYLPYPFTMQIGNHSLLAAKTGIKVVGDFRSLDMAHGGQGAPLAPLFHQAFLSSPAQKTAIVNIGGIANVTLLDGDRLIAAFDTGPGNALIDALSMLNYKEPFDRDGEFAQAGKTDSTLLTRLLQDPYFQKPHPKSTGKEYFNLNWLNARMREEHEADLDPLNLINTVTELTARSVSSVIQSFGAEHILICGGGAQNRFLMNRIQSLNPKQKLNTTECKGIPPQLVEPLSFAWLAKMRLEEQRLNLDTITGADRPLLLGQIFYSF